MKTLFRLIPLVLVMLLVLVAVNSQAQCAMCAAVSETSQEAGSSVADGLNKGILYILITPYLILATLGYFWWRGRRKARLAETEAEAQA